MRNYLISMLITWTHVLTRPGEKTFAAERIRPFATLSTALIWILLVKIVTVLLDILVASLAEMWVLPSTEVEFAVPSKLIDLIDNSIIGVVILLINLKSALVELYAKMWFYSGLYGLIGNFVYSSTVYISFSVFGELPIWQRMMAQAFFSPLRFLANMVIYHYVAVLLGGRGQFGRYAYLHALIAVPIHILSAFLRFVPLPVAYLVSVLPGSSFMASQNLYYKLKGSGNYVVSIVLLVYWLVLLYFIVKAEHRLTWWRAIIYAVVSYVLVYVLKSIYPEMLLVSIPEAGDLQRAMD